MLGLGVFLVACGNASDDRAMFLGTWDANDGATASALCGGDSFVQPLDALYGGEIQRDGDWALAFKMTDCTIRLAVEGGVARATEPDQLCPQHTSKTRSEARLKTFELRPTDNGKLETIAFGTTKLWFEMDSVAIDCEKFELSNVFLSKR